ncbi:MAG: hypothetical protein J6J36_02820 [Clostridia bacterium]|nr:hypothetical protein [Clostridia bacterium]
MKTSVDLTENRDFIATTKRKRKLREVLNDFSYNNSNLDLMVRHQNLIEKLSYDKGVIYQGNNQERKSKRFADSFSDGVCCDCCGRMLYPYHNDTICPQCSDKFEYRDSLRRIFWLERRN